MGNLDLILRDISAGNSYVCEEHGNIIAVFYYKEGDDPTYARIFSGQWLNELPYGAVHRITSDGTVKGRILRSTLIRITILCSTFLKRTVSHGVGSSSRRTGAKELLSRRPDSDLAVPERPA